jgi:hypothetical protein
MYHARGTKCAGASPQVRQTTCVSVGAVVGHHVISQKKKEVTPMVVDSTKSQQVNNNETDPTRKLSLMEIISKLFEVRTGVLAVVGILWYVATRPEGPLSLAGFRFSLDRAGRSVLSDRCCVDGGAEGNGARLEREESQ